MNDPSGFSGLDCGSTSETNPQAQLSDSILASLGDGVVAVDRDGKLLYSNAAAELVLQRPIADTPIRSWPERYGLYLPDKTTQYPPDRFPLARALDGHATESVCAFVPLPDQPDGMWLSCKAWPLASGHGPRGAAIGVFRDITDRRRLEEKLRKAEMMEAIGNLAGGVAHDFNNLLMIITGYAEIVAEGLDARDPRAGSLQEVVKAAGRAAALTRKLLAFSRRQLVQPRVVSLNRLINAMTERLKEMLGDKIEVSTVLDPRLGLVTVDPAEIEQAVWNLALNARDAMPDGGRMTILTSNTESAGGSCVTLSVSDTGHGMDENVKAHIFEPFFTTHAFGRGSGLGLSSVYGVVKQAGGDIRVYSEPGAGATFEIQLPRLDAPRHSGNRKFYSPQRRRGRRDHAEKS